MLVCGDKAEGVSWVESEGGSVNFVVIAACFPEVVVAEFGREHQKIGIEELIANKTSRNIVVVEVFNIHVGLINSSTYVKSIRV